MNDAHTILSFQNVTGKKGKFRLKNINIELLPGYIYGLVGKNGAGKTTLMNYIMDEHIKYEGQICINGADIRIDHAKTMNAVGFISEDNPFFEERTGKQNAELLGMFYEHFDMETFMESMNFLNISCNKTYKLMSKGERLKFQLAFAASHKPCLYLLDEATAGMDAVFRTELFEMLRDLIKDETCSILLTSHIMSEIKLKTDYAWVMENGEITAFSESPDMMSRLKGDMSNEDK